MERLHRMIRAADLGQYVGNLKRTQLDELIKRGEFPKPVRLSERRKAWIEAELIIWQQERIAKRERTHSP